MIYAFYIFSKGNNCIFYRVWSKGAASELRNEETFKLISGFVSTADSFINKISPVDKPKASKLQTFTTNTYKFSCVESPTGIKFVFITDHLNSDMKDELMTVYEDFYVEFVVKNPLQDKEQQIKNEKFEAGVEKYIKSLPAFTSKWKS